MYYLSSADSIMLLFSLSEVTLLGEYITSGFEHVSLRNLMLSSKFITSSSQIPWSASSGSPKAWQEVKNSEDCKNYWLLILLCVIYNLFKNYRMNWLLGISILSGKLLITEIQIAQNWSWLILWYKSKQKQHSNILNSKKISRVDFNFFIHWTFWNWIIMTEFWIIIDQLYNFYCVIIEKFLDVITYIHIFHSKNLIESKFYW